MLSRARHFLLFTLVSLLVQQSEGAFPFHIENQGVRDVIAQTSRECRMNISSICLPPYVNTPTSFVVSRKHKLATCTIEKVMSTFLAATTCFLNGPEKFLFSLKAIHTEQWSTRFCGDKIENWKPASSVPDWTFLAVVRHPISRFISGWMNKCIFEHDVESRGRCYNCHKDMGCFLDKLYERAHSFVKSAHERDFEEKHFLPQSWYCRFKKFPYKIVHYAETVYDRLLMSKEISDVLHKAKVHEIHLQYILFELNLKSPHATTNQILKAKYLKQLLGTPALMRRFMQIFYHDFIAFGFPLPNV